MAMEHDLIFTCTAVILKLSTYVYTDFEVYYFTVRILHSL